MKEADAETISLGDSVSTAKNDIIVQNLMDTYYVIKTSAEQLQSFRNQGYVVVAEEVERFIREREV